MNIQELPFQAEEYKARRKKLMESMGSGQMLLLGNSLSSINFIDNYYPFRQDSSFLYYIGISQPGLNALIDADEGTCILFGDEMSIDHVIWMGEQEKLHDLASKSGITTVRQSHEIYDYIKKNCHYLPPYRPEHTIRLEEYLDLKELNPSLKFIMSVVDQRNIKSESEIEFLRKASSLTSAMHREIILNAKEGMYEYELVALASQFAISNNASWSFTPILTVNGQTLHNHSYHNKLENGKLLLFDGGIEHVSGYAGDMTRSFPVGGKFSPLQKDIYDTVVLAHDKSRDLCKAGKYYKDIHLEAALQLATGLKEAGFMKEDPEDAVMEGAHALFYPHGLGHMIGLDVHDMENLGEDFVGYDDTIRRSEKFGLKSLRLGRPLEKGFAITIEPGIYFIPQLIRQWAAEKKHDEFINYDKLLKHLDFGGIRIENDYVINDEGASLLGDALPYQSDEIIELLKQ